MKKRYIQLPSGHLLYHKERKDSCVDGFGIIINKKLTNHIITLNGVSKIVTLKIDIKYSAGLCPNNSNENQEVDSFYEVVFGGSNKNWTEYSTVLGDYNWKKHKREEIYRAIRPRRKKPPDGSG